MSRARSTRLVLLIAMWFGCVDPFADTNSGSDVNVDENGGVRRVQDLADDGNTVDCDALGGISLFESNENNASPLIVEVSFPSTAVSGDEFAVSNGDATVSVQTDTIWNVNGGSVTVNINQNAEADLAVTVTLNNISSSDGRLLTGHIDCVETAGDAAASSCANGDGDNDADSDSD